MILRDATSDDALELAKLGRESFCAAFGHLYAEADLNAFLDEVYSQAVVAEEIAQVECIHKLAANDSGLIGFCKLRRPSWYAEHSDAQSPVALGQLYTAPGKTGLGIGAALMEWSVAFSREGGHDAIQLSVWSENFGAQRFYERYGFRKIADIDFQVGNHRDDEFLYELGLD